MKPNILLCTYADISVAAWYVSQSMQNACFCTSVKLLCLWMIFHILLLISVNYC